MIADMAITTPKACIRGREPLAADRDARGPRVHWVFQSFSSLLVNRYRLPGQQRTTSDSRICLCDRQPKKSDPSRCVYNNSMAKYVPPSRRPGYVPPSTTASTPHTVSTKSSYLPPGRVGSSYTARSGSSSGPTYSIYEVSRHFTHPRDSTLTFFAYPLPPHERPPRPAYDPTHTPETAPLPPSPPPPPPTHPLSHLLSYIVVFPHANPLWREKNELWLHTGARKMMADWVKPGERRNFGRPVPVFVSAKHDEVAWQGWW